MTRKYQQLITCYEQPLTLCCTKLRTILTRLNVNGVSVMSIMVATSLQLTPAQHSDSSVRKSVSSLSFVSFSCQTQQKMRLKLLCSGLRGMSGAWLNNIPWCVADCREQATALHILFSILESCVELHWYCWESSCDHWIISTY